MKRFRGILIGAGIELFFFAGTEATEYESFFLLFSLLFGVLLIYNLFTYGKGELIKGVSGKSGTSANSFRSKQSEDLYGSEKFTERTGGGIFDSTNLVMLLFTALNVSAYIIVMPK